MCKDAKDKSRCEVSDVFLLLDAILYEKILQKTAVILYNVTVFVLIHKM